MQSIINYLYYLFKLKYRIVGIYDNTRYEVQTKRFIIWTNAWYLTDNFFSISYLSKEKALSAIENYKTSKEVIK